MQHNLQAALLARGAGTRSLSLTVGRCRRGSGRSDGSRRGVRRPWRHGCVEDGGTWSERQSIDDDGLTEPRSQRQVGDVDGSAYSCTVATSVPEEHAVTRLSIRRRQQRMSASIVAVAVRLRRHCVDSTTFTTTFPTCP